jgi:hypothetical protein
MGNISLQVSSAGINPGVTGGDYVLAVYSIPANFFDAAGRAIQFSAAGSIASNANLKTIKLIANPSAATVGSAVTGGTTLMSTGTFSGSSGQTGFFVEAVLQKYGSGGSNTQIGYPIASFYEATASLVAGANYPQLLTATESGAILVCVTGNAATLTSDITLNVFTVQASN